MRTLHALLLTVCLLSLAHAAHADAWDDLLAGAGLTRDTCRFNLADEAFVGQGDYRLPTYTAMHDDPLSVPFHTRILRASVLGSAGSAGDLVMAGAGRIDAGTRLALLGDPLAPYLDPAKKPDALRDAILGVWTAAGRKPSRAEERLLEREVAKVPADVAQQAAMVLLVEARAITLRNRALAPVLREGLDLARFFRLFSGQVDWDDERDQPDYERFMRAVDLPRLMVGGELTAIAADRAATALTKRAGAEVFSFRAWTPYGWVILNGDGNDTVGPNMPALLILDTGGDDTYASGAATLSEAYPASVLIDLKGNDRYINVPEVSNTPVMQSPLRKTWRGAPSFGAGILGYGVLIDAAGNDTYRSLGSTQGRAWFGVGVLQDRAGNDTYDGYHNCQGCGDWGVGILQDRDGTDTYHCLDYSQGYGGTKGFGLLLDQGAGDDTFTAEDAILDAPSGQTTTHNNSMAQGVGNGRRADFSDGHSLAGGIGVLLDDGGKNTLTAGVFAQGAGYWMGVGACLLGPGDDTMNGSWYVQGAAAHFAVGVLDDLGGNDTRRATNNMAQGAGHDFSVGWLIDHGGNDRYEAPNLSLGGGNACGFGFFWDMGGDDTYVVKPSVTLGRAGGGSANSIRERNPTLGLFLDAGGKDTYPADIPQAKNDNRWTLQRGQRGKTGDERGCGLDTEAPGLGEPK